MGSPWPIGLERRDRAPPAHGISLLLLAVLAPRAMLERNVRLGERVRVGVGAVIGGDPQDLKFKGEETWAEVGDDTVIREYVTMNRGTTDSFVTKCGKGCLLMSYVHLGHDCHLGDGVIVSRSPLSTSVGTLG